MKKIGGNIGAIVQIKQTQRNFLGETINEFKDLKTIKGFLDYITGESGTGTFNAKIEDSTHIFLCDYEELSEENNVRFLIDGKHYEVKMTDVPMGINHHMEIYLRYVGE